MRVAIVHDWLTGMRGGERCLEVFCEIYPDADIYTLLYFPGSVSPTIERRRIYTSPVQHLPWTRTRYRQYLPLFPLAVRRLRPRGYDLLLSSSHCVAKGISTGGTPHICYCHTPMRYVWDRFPEYFGPGRPLLHRLVGLLLRHSLQRWDRQSNSEVGLFLANSRHVAGRIRTYYGRDSEVVYPPVSTERFHPGRRVEDYYLVVSALAPYKRIDLAVRAFRRRKGRLLVVGRGQEEPRLRNLAGPGVSFLGWRSDEEVAGLMQRCRAFILAGQEDFGITPLEVMASGRPVVALAQGGALETLIDVDDPSGRAPTGVLFQEPSVDSLVDGIDRLERHLADFDPLLLRAHAERFSRPRFRREMEEKIDRFLKRPPEL